ncbi:Glucose dehydrogenase [FAD, quinone] [Orchesella cincta]|uniref:Glucose dehydrogenase [FAD, quinone] n=1 Tax=Orchesella cincta TaxID=48709 RepID=A0A1D2M2I9_ORCCI|nr:Glucose dehydrogenase [FAD, quinone] [Orchesella cincta]
MYQEDFNRWSTEDLGGDPQWNYENLLPYFKKSEDYHGNYARDPASAKYHGKGGLLNVARYDFEPGVDDFLAAALEKGYAIGDYNGATQEGCHLATKYIYLCNSSNFFEYLSPVFSKVDATTQDGWRESTYRAFYSDTGKPSNLCIKKYAHVIKINFQNVSGPKAVGVTTNAKIALVKDLPVGENTESREHAGRALSNITIGQPGSRHNYSGCHHLSDERFQEICGFVRKYGSSQYTPLFYKPVPGCENKVFKSDDYYRCVIRMSLLQCTIMWEAALLEKLVMGIDGLRVIDASVMPDYQMETHKLPPL